MTEKFISSQPHAKDRNTSLFKQISERKKERDDVLVNWVLAFRGIFSHLAFCSLLSHYLLRLFSKLYIICKCHHQGHLVKCTESMSYSNSNTKSYFMIVLGNYRNRIIQTCSLNPTQEPFWGSVQSIKRQVISNIYFMHLTMNTVSFILPVETLSRWFPISKMF